MTPAEPDIYSLVKDPWGVLDSPYQSFASRFATALPEENKMLAHTEASQISMKDVKFDFSDCYPVELSNPSYFSTTIQGRLGVRDFIATRDAWLSETSIRVYDPDRFAGDDNHWVCSLWHAKAFLLPMARDAAAIRREWIMASPNADLREYAIEYAPYWTQFAEALDRALAPHFKDRDAKGFVPPSYTWNN